MTRERIFYIAYRICTYMRNREMQNQFEEYEFCMHISDMANDIENAINNNDCNRLNNYYEALYDELENICNLENYVVEVEELIALLDECKGQIDI